MGYKINELEGRNGGRDWPVIVQSVECPVCLAQPGAPCTTVKANANPLIQTGRQRIDWHVERKQLAALLWEQKDEYTKENIPVEDVKHDA